MLISMSSVYDSIGYAPIGVITRNRPEYLDMTLRSLSATKLPLVPVVVYDDSSDLDIARAYLYTSDSVILPTIDIPSSLHGFVPEISRRLPVRGIHGRIPVVGLLPPVGVVYASVQALQKLLLFSNSEYVCLLQDDIILVPGWYQLMSLSVAKSHPGILAGIIFGSADCIRSQNIKKDEVIENNFVQAQCLFISRELVKGFIANLPAQYSVQSYGFDTLLCDYAMQSGATIASIYPHICQHIGTKSLVRPTRPYSRKGGRYSKSISETLAVADDVRVFPWSMCARCESQGTVFKES